MNWKQMEWPGWDVEEMGRKHLIEKIGGDKGPKFGHTQFDYENSFVWDLKVHSKFKLSGRYDPWTILNDTEAVWRVIDQFGGIGYVIGVAEMEFDHDGEFKKWHDELKGNISDYEKERKRRCTRSRIRKVSCRIVRWLCIFLTTYKEIEEGLLNGWARGFQQGMRNADGSSCRVKIMINLDELPSEIILFDYPIK